MSVIVVGVQGQQGVQILQLLIMVATSGFITTDAQLDGLTGLGTGVMLFANIPIILIFSRTAMREYHDYLRRLRSGEIKAETA